MLTLICGHPRAGKTTYSKQFEGVCKILHLDYCGRYGGVIQSVQHLHGDIVVEGVYNKAEQRKALIRAYHGRHTKCIWLDTPLEVRQTREGYRKHNEYFEPPTYSEGWDEIIIIGDNNGESN